MAYFSRTVGDVQQMVDIFIQDATVSTGAGFPNLEISTFSSYYHRSDMTSTSSVVMVSTGTLGTWASGQFLQINSTFMRGWYQLCCPDDMFVNGSTVALHMYGHPSIAPAPVVFDITRFNPQSATVDAKRVGVSSFGLPVGVSSFALAVDVTSFSGNAVTVTEGKLTVDVSTFFGSRAVTTLAGTLGVGRVGVSSFGLPVGVSSFALAVDVTSFSGNAVAVTEGKLTVDVSTFFGSRAVTTAAGILGVGRVGVSSFDLPVGVSSFALAVDVTSFSGNAVTVTEGKLTVDVSTFFGSRTVTTAAGTLGVGRVGVSSFGLPVGVSTLQVGVSTSWFSGGDVVTSVAGVLASHVTSMRVAVDRQIADAFLGRNVSSGGDGIRTVSEALYLLRNRSESIGGTLTVYTTDDTVTSWNATVSTASGNPVVGIDPD